MIKYWIEKKHAHIVKHSTHSPGNWYIVKRDYEDILHKLELMEDELNEQKQRFNDELYDYDNEIKILKYQNNELKRKK